MNIVVRQPQMTRAQFLDWVDRREAPYELVSPTSGRTGRILKLREYHAVKSVRRYVILDRLGPDLTVYSRAEAGLDWTAVALTSEDTLRIPEVGIEVPISELYAGIVFPDCSDE